MSAATIQRFYDAFARLDSATMAACYVDDARFDDEAFSLKGRPQIGGMWRMLCQATQAKGLAHWRLEVRDIVATPGPGGNGGTGAAHWDAHYLFSATGRLVLNRIDAEFEFDNQGLIRRHRDRFDLWRWARQALGAPGLLLGWSPFLRNQVRARAAKGLQHFLAKG